MGRRPELVGGDLIRSLGDWSQVISQRRKSETCGSDARLLAEIMGMSMISCVLISYEQIILAIRP